MTNTDGIDFNGPIEGRFAEVLTPAALDFRGAPPARVRGDSRGAAPAPGRAPGGASTPGARLDFLAETRGIARARPGRSRPPRRICSDRWVELTGPAERKMVINALNSGADVFMADFEDANTPTWHNMVQGQVNLVDAVARTIDAREPGRPRLPPERADRDPARPPRAAGISPERTSWSTASRCRAASSTSASTSSTTAAAARAWQRPLLLPAQAREPSRGAALERRLRLAAGALGLPRGTIRATVLIETILAAFEMDEILYELRDHSAGSTRAAGITSSASSRSSGRSPTFVLPDRAQVTMTVPFMRAYTELLVKTCHRRGAHAIGGMAAFIPSRRDPQVNEVALARVREDKQRESQRRLRRHLGRPPRPRARRARSSSTAPRRPPAPDRAPAPRGDGGRRRRCSTSGCRAGKVTEAGPAEQHERRPAVPRGLAGRERRRRDLQPDGRRRDRRDLARRRSGSGSATASASPRGRR